MRNVGASARDDLAFWELLADGSPLALALALQYRTALALRVLRRSALERALAGAGDELGADVRRAVEEEIATRHFRSAWRLAHPRARPFFARTFPEEDPVHEAIAALPRPGAGKGAAAEHEEAYLQMLARLATDRRSAAARAAGRALERLSFGEAETVAPIVTTFRRPCAPLVRGTVLRARIDFRVTSDRPRDVILRRGAGVGKRFRRAAIFAQELAGRLTGDPLFRRVGLEEAPLTLPVDGPSAGLAIFAATALVATHRNPPPPWIGFSGAFDEDGVLWGTGQPMAKIAAAIEGGVRALFLPESARPEVREDVRAPIEIVYLPRAGPEELFSRIEREIAELAPRFLRLKIDDARKVYARAERLFSEGKKEALGEFTFLVRALGERDDTDAFATLGAVARAKLGRCYSRSGDSWRARDELSAAEARLKALVTEKRLEREGREALAELGVYRAINLLDFRDFEGALAAADASLELKERDPYTPNHSLARSHGTRAIVLYSWAKTLEDAREREAKFASAEAALEANMRCVQPFERGRVRGYCGTLALYRGRFEEAARIFREILEPRADEGPGVVDPRWARDGLAHALHELGRHEEAVEVASAAIDVGIDEEIRGRLLRWKGAALRELGWLDEAGAALEAAARELGRWPEGHPKNALAIAAWLELALVPGEGEAALDRARALCTSFRDVTVRAHFAPTRAAIAGGPPTREALRSALARLLP